MSTAALCPFTRIGRQDGQRSLSHGSGQNQRSVIVSVFSARRDKVERIDQWAARQAREMVSAIEAREVSDDITQRPMSREARYVMQEKPNLRLEDKVEVPNITTATLVQMWREIEAEGELASRRASGACSVASNSRTITNVSNNGSFVGEQSAESEDSDFTDDQSTDWESAVKTPIAPGVSYGGGNEKGRVADVVRRFTERSSAGNSSEPIDEIDSREQTPRSHENVSSELFDHVTNQGREVVGNHKSGSLNYRRIRDTRAFKDFLIRMEGERLRELRGIGERHVVSQFAHKVLIQSMLRLRSLSREVMVQGQKNPPSSVQLDQLQPGTSVLLLRQKFNTKGKPNAVSNDMLESNSSRKQREHMENPSFDNLHQIYSRGSKQIVKKGSQREEIIRKQEEMDLILELRRDMTRIRQEVSDLKRMVTSCIVIQLELHRYVKEGVYSPQKCQTEASLTTNQQATRHGNCCVCSELQIDSLLYMCGLMCACFKCAYELQSKSGSCPICRASFTDVVRVHSNS